MEAYSQNLLKLRIDSLTHRRLLFFWIVFASVLFAIYSVCAFISKEPEMTIEYNNSCFDEDIKLLEKESNADKTVLCPFWDYKNVDIYTASIKGFTNFNKYILLQMVPIFKESFSFEQYKDYINDNRQTAFLKSDKISESIDSNVKIDMVYRELNYDGKEIKNKTSFDMSFNIKCDLKKKSCKPFKLWWNPTLSNGIRYSFK